MSIDFMASAPDAVVEPWHPKIGDRVRVRLNGECQLQFPATAPGRLADHESFDGYTGTVVQPPWNLDPVAIAFLGSQGHSYAVKFDPGQSTVWAGDFFAACELELLED